MKILLTNFHTGHGGGHDTYLVSIAKALAGRHQMYVAAPPTSRLYERAKALKGVAAVPMPFPGKIQEFGSMWCAARALRAFILRERIDVVHVNGSADHRLVMFATAALDRRKPRIVLTKHNSIRVGRGWASVIRASIATHHVIAVSDFTERMMRETPYGRCEITVVKNGVDIARFTQPDAAVVRQRRCAIVGESNADKIIVGTVTGFEWYKGTMDMVEAIGALPAAVRGRVHLVVAGPQPNAEQWATIDKLDLRGAISAIGRVDDVRECIAAFDMGFVLSFAIETVSFACREMMAMGKPVMVTRYAGLPENIEDGVNGWIVEAQAPSQLAERLTKIVADASNMREMGRRARLKSEAEFCDQHFIGGTESVYERLYRQKNR